MERHHYGWNIYGDETMLCTLEKKPFRRFSRYKEAQRSTLKSIPAKKLWNLLQRGGKEGKTHRHPHYSRISSFFDNKTLLLLKSGRKKRSGLRFNYHLFFPDRYITILYAWSQFHSPRYLYTCYASLVPRVPHSQRLNHDDVFTTRSP